MSRAHESSTVPDYHPRGLCYDQIVNLTGEERSAIPEAEWEHFRQGLVAAKGQEGLDQLGYDGYQAFLRQRRAAMDPEDVAAEDRQPTEYAIQLFRDADIDESNPPPDDEIEFEEWGFFVYRTAGYDDPDTWRRAKAVWDEQMADLFAADVERGSAGASAAQRKFSCRWIEGPEWDGASPQAVGEDFEKNQCPGVYLGFAFNLALCINEASLRSLLEPDTVPCPYVLAVASGGADKYDEDEHDDEHPPWCGYFNVAIDVLAEDVYPQLAGNISHPEEMGGFIGPDQVYAGLLNTIQL